MTSLLPSSSDSPTARMREYGHWSEVVSSAGKVYYYNRVTEKSQWIKPDGWEKAETVIFPVIDRMHRIKRGSDSGYTENDPVDFVPSDDDMDVSDGLSSSSVPSLSASSPDSSPSRPPSVSENEEEVEKKEEEVEKEEEEEEEEPAEEDKSPHARFYRPELIEPLRSRFLTEEMQNFRTTRLASEQAFEVEYTNQRIQMYRARALVRTSLAKVEVYHGEASALRAIQEKLEENRARFQSNFHAEVRRLLKREGEEEEQEDNVETPEEEVPSTPDTDVSPSQSFDEPSPKKMRL